MSGTVLDSVSKRPLSGVQVWIADRHDTTGTSGRFALTASTHAYDLVVADADHARISLYRGLSRPEPILLHRTEAVEALDTSAARVSGTLSGSASYPLAGIDQVVVVYALTELGNGQSILGAGAPASGPDYALNVQLVDGSSTSGVLLAVGTFGAAPGAPATDPLYSAAGVTLPLTLKAGETLSQDLELAALDQTTVSGSVSLPAGSELFRFFAFYRFPFPEGVVMFPNANIARQKPIAASGAFAYQIPDLRAFGGTPCISAIASPGTQLRREKCGASVSDPVELAVQAAPSFTAPSVGSVLTSSTQFSWTEFQHGISALTFLAGSPTSSQPTVTVFTAGTSATFPNLASLGIAYPAGVTYDVSIEGLGPFDSIDEATGPDGRGSLVPAETIASISTARVFTTAR